jgi:predicted lipid-binding transport protein (Tim44 family)
MLALAGPLLGGAVAGSLLGAWIATGFGSLRAWVSSALSGVVVAWVVAAAYFLWAIQASGV